MLGCGALDITDTAEPTMRLGLLSRREEYNEHIIVHEFGHAYGLQHEHQRSCFLDVAKKYLDETKMKAFLRRDDPNYSDDNFLRDYWERAQGIESPDYDCDSVMHYW